MKIKLPSSVEFIINEIEKNNKEAFIVGGCVRDSILGLSPNDYDITTSAEPDEILEIFKGYKTINNGIKHGTVGVILENEVYEITTYRIEGEYIKNRRPKDVEFTSQILMDLKRRDFTINAMAYNEEKKLVDYFGGIKDLENKIIKTVGDPDERFIEDGLRIIRAIRFSSKLNFEIEKNTLKSIKENASIIKNISKERISDEIQKIILSNNPQKLGLLYKLNIFNELGIYCDIKNYDLFYLDLIMLNKCKKDINKRLLMIEFLLVQNGNLSVERYNEVIKDKSIVNKLRYPNSVKSYIDNTVEYMIGEMDTLDKFSIKKILNKIGFEKLNTILELRKIYYENSFIYKNNSIEKDEKIKNINKMLIMIENIKNNKECYNIKELKINGSEIKSMGYNGKEIGSKLEYLLEMVMKNPQINEKAKLINLLKTN